MTDNNIHTMTADAVSRPWTRASNLLSKNST